MEIRKSDLVIALAGHDKGKLFFVKDINSGFAEIIDGKSRKVVNPKRKSIKHLRFQGKSASIAAEKLLRDQEVTNKELRRGLAEFSAHPAEHMEVC